MNITETGVQNAWSESVYERIFEMASDLEEDDNARLVYMLYAWVLVGRSLDESPSVRDKEELTTFIADNWAEVEWYATSAALLHADADLVQ